MEAKRTARIFVGSDRSAALNPDSRIAGRGKAASRTPSPKSARKPESQ
jgi:hypothetical protein